MAKHGAHVIVAVRNVKLGDEVCGEIHRETPAARLDVMRLDLNSLASDREFAADFKARNLPLNILRWVLLTQLSLKSLALASLIVL